MPDRHTPKRPRPAGFVLAGGTSRRMGADKATLAWGPSTLLDHMMGLVGAVADPVRAVGRGSLPDRHRGRGPVEGIATALETSRADSNLVVAVDLPLLSAAFLSYFVGTFQGVAENLLVCRIEGRIPLCLAIRAAARTEVDAYLESGRRSVKGMVAAIPHHAIGSEALQAAGFAPDIFRNVNDAGTYAVIRDS